MKLLLQIICVFQFFPVTAVTASIFCHHRHTQHQHSAGVIEGGWKEGVGWFGSVYLLFEIDN